MRVVTFYSYKGGVGRTQALVNVAAALERAGKRVLLVDFDLEAPGLDAIRGLRFDHGPGLVELIREYLGTGVAPNVEQFVRSAGFVDPVSRKMDLANLGLAPSTAGVFVLPSGDRRDELAYKRQLADIDFGDLYARRDGYLLFEDLRCQWRDRLKIDYVLIDSRTGHTDVGGICVRQLPDHVVLMFYPNEQNFQGIESIAAEARGDARSLEIDAVMSRVPYIDDYEQQLSDFESRARRKFKVPRVYRIHSYDSIHLLRDEVFLADGRLDRTRLSIEYRKLVRAIVTRNIGDRSGVLEVLEKGLSRVRTVVGSTRSSEWIAAVRSCYRSDDSVLECLAGALRRAGDDSTEGEVRTDLARIRSTSSAATDWRNAQSLIPSDLPAAAKLAARACAGGDELALSARLAAFLLMCRCDPELADQHAGSIGALPLDVRWVNENWGVLSRARGGMRVARTVFERAGYRPDFGPGRQWDGMSDQQFDEIMSSPETWEPHRRLMNHNDSRPCERLAVAMVALGPTTDAMIRYAEDREVENMALRVRAVHQLPIAPFRSDAEFGAWVRLMDSPGGSYVMMYNLHEVREPVGVRNDLLGEGGDVEFARCPMTDELRVGLPSAPSLELRVRAGIALALTGETSFAKVALQRLRELRAKWHAEKGSEPWLFNCWQMLRRPALELEQDLERVIHFHDTDEHAREHACERLFMRPPFLDAMP